MTDQDNLRNRVARVLAETYSPGGRGVQFEDAVAAQAIIDEFGMTVETRNDGCAACGEPPESRIVGKWEKQ